MAKKATASAVPLGLVGRFFHHAENNTIPAGHRHGIVRGQLSESHFLVEFKEDGKDHEAGGMRIMDLAELAKPEWQFFETVKHMKEYEAELNKPAGA